MSTEPEERSLPGRPRPPRLFAFAMVLCMALGFGGTMNGCNNLQFYRSSVREEPPVPNVYEAEREKWREFVRAGWDALDRARNTQVPLAAADLVLSALLLMVAWRALQGRPGTRGLMLQAVAANGALAVADYALSLPVRAAVVNALVEHMPSSSLPLPPSLPEGQLGEAMHQTIYLLFFRLPFGFKLAAYTLSLVALTLPSARAYLDDVEADGNAEALGTPPRPRPGLRQQPSNDVASPAKPGSLGRPHGGVEGSTGLAEPGRSAGLTAPFELRCRSPGLGLGGVDGRSTTNPSFCNTLFRAGCSGISPWHISDIICP